MLAPIPVAPEEVPTFSLAHNIPVAEGTGESETLVPNIDPGRFDAEGPGPAADGEDVIVKTEFDRVGSGEGAPALLTADEFRMGAALTELDCFVAVFAGDMEIVFDPVRLDWPGTIEEPPDGETTELEPVEEDPGGLNREPVEIEEALAICWLIVFDPAPELGLIVSEEPAAEPPLNVVLLEIISEL